MRPGPAHVALSVLVLAIVIAGAGWPHVASPLAPPAHAGSVPSGTPLRAPAASPSASNPVSNFTSSINRLVELVAAAGGGLLALVWARVAVSWFSNDIAKKVHAKDRARDALIGTLIFTAAITGLVWGLAQWVLTGA